MARKLGAWDCEYCETGGIWGNVFNCTGCGRPRSKRVRFYEVENAPIVTPEIAKQLGSGGPNWYCLHCDSGNKDNEEECWNCGAAKGSSPSHEVKEYREGESPSSTEEAEEADPDGESWVDPEPDPKNDYSSSSPPQRQRTVFEKDRIRSFNLGKKMPAIGLGAAILLVSFLIYQVFFSTHEEIALVSGFNWTQNVVVQEYQAVHESSWTSHPGDAYNVTSDYLDTGQDEKVHDSWKTVEYTDTCYKPVSYTDTCTRSVYKSKTCTGSRDNGDGSFSSYTYECGGNVPENYSCTKTRQESYSCTKTRQEEVYHYEDIWDTYYEYDINKWVTIANYPTSGNDHDPYFFSDFTLNNPYTGSGVPELGEQRQFQEFGEYSIMFSCRNTKVGNDGYFSYELSLEEWKKYDFNIDYPIEVNAIGTILTDPNP